MFCGEVYINVNMMLYYEPSVNLETLVTVTTKSKYSQKIQKILSQNGIQINITKSKEIFFSNKKKNKKLPEDLLCFCPKILEEVGLMTFHFLWLHSQRHLMFYYSHRILNTVKKKRV